MLRTRQGDAVLLALATTQPSSGLDLVQPDYAEMVWGVIGFVLLALVIAAVVWASRSLRRAGDTTELQDLQARVRDLEQHSTRQVE